MIHYSTNMNLHVAFKWDTIGVESMNQQYYYYYYTIESEI